MKVRFFINWTNFLDHYNFLNIWTNLMNLLMSENHSPKKEQLKMKIFHFLSKIAITCETWSQNLQSFLVMKIWFLLGNFFEKLNNKALYLTVFWCFLRVEKGCIRNECVNLPLHFVQTNSRKNWRDVDVFSVNQLGE